MALLNILIVEDEFKLLNHLEERMKIEDFVVFKCDSYTDLENFVITPKVSIDIIILDRLLNGQDSSDLISAIKENMQDAKIIVLSALNTAYEKTALLDRGVDDYLSKPFDIDELVARIRALLRRNSKELVFGNIILDTERRNVKVNGQEMVLQNKEFILLKTLIKTPGKIFNKKFLYEYVWEMSVDVESNVVEATVNKLRRRLEDAGANPRIKSMRNKGYWIEE